MNAHPVVQSLLGLFFDQRCIVCNGEHGPLCAHCLSQEKEVAYPCQRCGQPTEVKDTVVTRCPSCRKRRLYFARAWGLYRYEPPWDEVIRQVKFEGQHALIGTLTTRWQTFCGQRLSGLPGKTEPIVTWVPAQKNRQRDRSVLLSQALARQAAQAMGWRAAPMLKKVRATPPQMRLGAKERATNLRGAFEGLGPGLESGACPAHVVLVDDLYTTGHTVNECSRVLRQAGVKEVTVLTFARAALGQWR